MELNLVLATLVVFALYLAAGLGRLVSLDRMGEVMGWFESKPLPQRVRVLLFWPHYTGLIKRLQAGEVSSV